MKSTPMIDAIFANAQKEGSPRLTDEDKTGIVYRHLANAYVTALSAGGHGKGNSNEMQYNELREEMQSKGMEMPSSTILIAYGDFNGEGSV